MSEGKRPPRTTHTRHPQKHYAGHSHRHEMHPPPVYSPPSPPPATQFALFRALHPRIVRFAPTFILIGIVGAVLAGHGFWSYSMKNATDDPALTGTGAPALFNVPSALTENFPAIPTESNPSDNAPVAVNANALSDSALSNATTTSFTGYVSRPAASVTLPGQRIQIVPARRDDTADAIANRTGVSAKALMYANGITDATQPLTVGQVLRVPPAGTMLHRIKESDTLESIAKAYRVSVDEITAYKGNNVQQSGDLVPGNFLIIPTLNLPMREKVVFYQVRDGDSLSKITSFYNLSDPQTLQWANNLPSANLVMPGQIIAVPPVDGVIHVVEPIDTQRTTDDAITQIAKNFACTAVPCTETPSDERVNALAAAIFAFGPNHLTHGGKLIEGQEIVIPNGKPFVEPPPVIIPQTVIIDNPGTSATSGSSASVSTTSNGGSVTAVTTTQRTTTATTNSGTRTTTTITTNSNYGGGGGGVAGVASRFLGQYRQANGVPWSGYCEKFVGDVGAAAGVGHNRYATAISDAYSGKLYGGRAPAGSLVFFDQSWSWAGHVGIAMGDGTMISALGGGIVRTAYEGSGGYIGWRPFP